MPSAKPRVSVTITDQLQKTLNSLWRHYPDLEGHLLESIQFLMIYGSEAIARDRTLNSPSDSSPKPTTDASSLEPKQEFSNPDDAW